MTRTVCYEQPLNERVRALLRLEFLFHQAAHNLQGRSQWDSRNVLESLFDIMSLTGRNELKAELLKELDRQSMMLARVRQLPDVDLVAVEDVQDEIHRVSRRLHGVNAAAVDRVRQSEFLNAIRQRSSIPGGTCRFDMPALHHWLQSTDEDRTRDLEDWLSPFQPMCEGVDLILRLVRSSAHPHQELAQQGFFQRALDSTAPSQMVRVVVPSELGVFPEISGGRHRFSIRFLSQADVNQRAAAVKDDIAFELTCCVI